MDDSWRAINGWFGEVMRDLETLLSAPWSLAQIAIAAILFGLATVIALILEPRLEARARGIRGQPGVLRIVVAVLRRTRWLVYVLLLTLAIAVVRALPTPPGERFLLLALALSATWFAAGVASRAIRNRFVARLVQWLAWIYVALVLLAIDDNVAALLDRAALPLGTFRLSVLLVVKAAIFLTVAVWLAVLIGGFIETRVARSGDLTPSFQVLIGKMAKIGLVVAAGAIALSAVGVDLTALTIFSGAVGVGIGFGLQKVVSNFVSGVIILLDKSIKPGDTISLGETFGWIRDLRARFVSVVTRDGREYLIPNEDFITQQVINWSFSDDLVRLDVKFGVSYDANPHEVSEVAIKAAMRVARVEEARRPVCWLTGFGDSSLDFVLRFWIHDPQQGLTNVRGKVLLALWDAFQEAGIGIPYPHRELIVKPGQEIFVRQAPAAQAAPPGSRRRNPASSE